MKYMYILNNEVLFQTNSAKEYYDYIMNMEEDKYIRYTILLRLLEQSPTGYVADMATTN